MMGKILSGFKTNSLLKYTSDPYIIIGAGGHAKVIIETLRLENKLIYGF